MKKVPDIVWVAEREFSGIPEQSQGHDPHLQDLEEPEQGTAQTSLPPKQQIRVLEKYQPFLRMFAVFNADNFQTNDRRVLIRNILRAMLMFVPLLSLFTVSCYNFIWPITQENEWHKQAYQFAAGLVEIQQFTIYMFMASKNRRIFDARDQLQQLVDAR